jgi:hypothetical protein
LKVSARAPITPHCCNMTTINVSIVSAEGTEPARRRRLSLQRSITFRMRCHCLRAAMVVSPRAARRRLAWRVAGRRDGRPRLEAGRGLQPPSPDPIAPPPARRTKSMASS